MSGWTWVHDCFEFFQCPVVSCEECADGLVQDVADLLETELAVVAEFDDLSVGVVELFDRGSERGGVDRFRGGVVWILDTGVLEVGWVGWPSVATSPAELVADAVHGDAEQPRLESALFVVAILAEFGRYGDKHGLGNLLGKVVVMKPGACHCKDPAGIGVHKSAPSVFLALDRLVNEETDCLVLQIR